MELHFNATKESRKAMVEAISKELGIKAKYMGVPSCACEKYFRLPEIYQTA